MIFQGKDGKFRQMFLMALFLALASIIVYSAAFPDMNTAIFFNSKGNVIGNGSGNNIVVSTNLNGTSLVINFTPTNTSAVNWSVSLLNVTLKNNYGSEAIYKPGCTNSTNLTSDTAYRSVTCNIALANYNGNYTLNANLSNSTANSGNISYGLVIDNTAPNITISDTISPNGTWFSSSTGAVEVRLNFTVDDLLDNGTSANGGFNCTIRVFNETTSGGSNEYNQTSQILNNTLNGIWLNYTFPALANRGNGTYNYTVNCSDWGANWRSTAATYGTRWFTVDSADPAVIITLKGNTNTTNGTVFYTGAVNFTWNVTDNLDNGTTCNISIGETAGVSNITSFAMTNNTPYTYGLELPFGYHKINITCWDRAGYKNNANSSGNALWVNVTVPFIGAGFNGSSSTNLSTVANVSTITGFVLSSPFDNEKITWSGTVNARNAMIGEHIKTGELFIAANSSSLDTTFNSTATLRINLSMNAKTTGTNASNVSACPTPLWIAYTIGNASGATFGAKTNIHEYIAANGTDCYKAGHCTNIACTNGLVTFTVNSFSGYAALGNANLTTYGTASVVADRMAYFNASYVNRTNQSKIINGSDAACLIEFSDNGNGGLINTYMSFNTIRMLYEYNGTPTQVRSTLYNITCNATGFTTLSVVNDVLSVTSPTPEATGGGATSGRAGGGSVAPSTVTVSATTSGTMFTTYTYDKMSVSVDGQKYVFTLDKSYIGTKAQLTIGSATFEISKGETKNVDVDKDGSADVSVTLNNAYVNKVVVTVKELAVKTEAPKPQVKKEAQKVKEAAKEAAPEAAPEAPGAAEESTGAAEGEGATAAEAGGMSAGLIATIVVVLVIIIGGIYFYLQKKE